jgi:hypothetical protein
MSFFDKICDGASVIADAYDSWKPDAGDVIEGICDKAGAPEWLGDTLSLGANLAAGDYLAAAADVTDLAEDAPEAYRALKGENHQRESPDPYRPGHHHVGHGVLQVPAANLGDYAWRDGAWVRC